MSISISASNSAGPSASALLASRARVSRAALSRPAVASLTSTVAAPAAFVAAPAAFALSPEERAFEAAAGYQKAVSQCENDACAALLTPKLVVANGGAKSAKVVVSGPASDKLPKGDFVDCVWLSNSRGSILRAAEFKPLGKAINAAASTDATPVRPTIEFRVDKGNQVVPFIHCASGATFQGAAVDL